MQTPPGIARPVSRPHVVPPSADTPEARLAALEQQRSHDHQVMYELAAALAALQTQVVEQSGGLRALTESGLSLRQEVFAARSDLAAVSTGANDAAQSAAMAQMAVTVEAKFAALDALTTQLVAGVQTLGAREQMMEHVVEQQAAGQPKQEGIITDAFLQLDAKISRVAALAKIADGTDVATRAHNVVPFTAAMSADIAAFKNEFKELPKHVTTEILRLMAPLNVQHTEERVKILAQDECLQSIENRMIQFEAALIDANSRMVAPTCSVCTPAAAPLSLWGHSPPVVSETPGVAASSGDGDPMGAMGPVICGNGVCHSIHVTELQERVDKLEAAPRAAAAGYVPDP